jgi:hypothetical protein
MEAWHFFYFLNVPCAVVSGTEESPLHFFHTYIHTIHVSSEGVAEASQIPRRPRFTKTI